MDNQVRLQLFALAYNLGDFLRQRMIYLKSYGFWYNIQAYYKSPETYIDSARVFDPDIIIRLVKNERLHQLLPLGGSTLDLGSTELVYCKKNSFGDYVFFEKCR